LMNSVWTYVTEQWSDNVTTTVRPSHRLGWEVWQPDISSEFWIRTTL